MDDFLILRTIIKIAAKYSDAVLHCQEVSLEGSCSLGSTRCRIITVWCSCHPYGAPVR